MRMFSAINRRLRVFYFVPLFVWAAPSEMDPPSMDPPSEFGLSMLEGAFVLAEQTEPSETTKLSPEEQIIYNQLGPVYQKIFLYALTSDMRHRVVIYVCRGLNPFEAINVILRAEQRKYESGKVKRPFTPSERAAMQKKRSTEITG